MHTLVARVAERGFFVAVQQFPGHVQVIDVGRRAGHAVHQAGMGVHADVGLHA